MQTTKQEQTVVGHQVLVAEWNQFSTIQDRKNPLLAENLDPHIIMAFSKDEAMCHLILSVDLFQYLDKDYYHNWC